MTEFLIMETSQDIVSCYPVNHMLLDLACRRNSRFVGWRSDYEGHQSNEATKVFKLLSIGIVYKATWKAMKKKAFIWLLCLPTFLHLRMRPKDNISSLEDETKRLAKVHQFCSAMRRRIRFFYMLWQYKLDKNFDLTFEESGSLLSSMTANICFKMLMKSSVKHFPSTEFSRDFWKEASRSWVGGQWLALAASRLSHTDSRWTRAASVYSSSADIWPSK